MNRLTATVCALLSSGAVVLMAVADDDEEGHNSLSARLSGFQEPPSVSSTGSGRIRMRILSDTMASYELRFANLEGDVTQAHIHFAQPGVNGGIMVWLCGTDALPGPTGTPRCGGPRSGGASRTITAADVIGPSGQGIGAGEFAEFLRAVRTGYAYANVHSSRNAGGEIRGQLKRNSDD
jgi:hypothetical protein